MDKSVFKAACQNMARARSTQEVVVLTNEFVARLPLDVTASLPKESIRRYLRSPDDVNVYAYDLRVLKLEPGSRGSVIQMQLASVVCSAAARIAALRTVHYCTRDRRGKPVRQA